MIILNERLKTLMSPKFLDMPEKSCMIKDLNSSNLPTKNIDWSNNKYVISNNLFQKKVIV